MMQKFETRARQFSLVGGTRQATSDLMAFAEPGSSSVSDAHKGTIYILVEAGEPVAHSREACLLAARTIQRAFNEDNSYSIAAAMRRAITAANKAVYQRNIGQSVGQRAGVGVTVAVIKESDLFVAQVQPAQAYVLSEGALRAMPAHPSWDPAHVSVAPFSRAGALGASLFIDPEFFRCSLRLGEAVLLCSSSFSPLLSRPDTEQFMRLRDPAATLDQLFVIAAQNNLGDAHALFVELQPIPRSTAQPEAKRPDSLSAPGRPLMRRIGGWVSQITGGLTGTPRSSQSAMSAPQPQPDPLTTMPEQPRFSVNPPSLPAPLDIGEDLGRRYARARQEREQRQSERLASSADLPPSTYLGEEIYPVPSSRRIDLGDGPALAASARPYRSRYEMRPFVDLTWRERLALPFRYLLLAIDEARRNRKVRPTNLPPAILRGQGLSYRRNRLAFPWLLLLGLTLVIAALIVYGMTLTRQNDQQLALEYLTAAETRLANVREAANESTALDALDLARQAIDEVRASPNVTDTNPPLWLRYQEIQREYERALAAVQHQTFLDSPTVLATHPQPNGGFGGIVVPPAATTTITDPYQIEALRFIYALDSDKTNARLYRIPRDGGDPQMYLSPSTQIGETIVGPLRSAVWRIDQVVAIDQAPEGFGYYFRNGDTWNYSKLGGSEIWAVRDRLRICQYDGNLYIWGAVPNEVLKFRSGSYGDTPEYWLDPASLNEVDLSTVVDMSVDGAIYLLRSNGSVVVFSQGRPVSEIKPQGITPAISAATTFYVTSDGFGGGSLFIIEPSNERIIQLDKLTGKVIQQMKVRAESDLQLDHLGDIVVDTSGSRTLLYVVNGDQLIRSELPAPPRPFRDESATPTP